MNESTLPTLPFTTRIPLYRRALLFLAFVFMVAIAIMMLQSSNKNSELYFAAGFIFILVALPALGIAALPITALTADKEGIAITYHLFRSRHKKVRWSDIVRIEGVRSGKNTYLAIETIQDREKIARETTTASLGRFVAGQLVSDNAAAGEYIPSMFLSVSPEKTAVLLNTLKTAYS